MLTQPHKCEMGTSSFSTTSRLKVVSMTRVYLLKITSTDRTTRENFPFLMSVLTVLILLLLLLTSQELIHWLILSDLYLQDHNKLLPSAFD